MRAHPREQIPENHRSVLLIVAAPKAVARRALEHVASSLPGFRVTAIAPPGTSLSVDRLIEVPSQGPYGFALRPTLLRDLRRQFEIAYAVVADLDNPAFKRVALMLRLARAREKAAFGPNGAVIPLHEWLERSGISLGLKQIVYALTARLLAPFRRRRATRMLSGPQPPWGFRRINIGVSDRCNHRCIMCSEHSTYCADGGRRMSASDVLDESDFGLMDSAMYRRLIDDIAAMDCREIELCGLGEPLLHPRLLDFISQAKDAGIWVRLVTNASLLNAAKIRRLVRLGLDEIHISLNAGTPETYAKVHGVGSTTFERVLEAIRGLKSEREQAGSPGPAIEVSFVVQADNYREPVTWVEVVAAAGADIITFSALGAAPKGAPVQLDSEQMEEAKEKVAAAVRLAESKGLEVRGTFGALADQGTSFSESLYTYMPCYIGYIFALVTAAGRIHPCCACERVVGDLREGGFAHAWQGETYERFREECLDLPNRLPNLDGCSCMSCPYGPWNVEFHDQLFGRSL